MQTDRVIERVTVKSTDLFEVDKEVSAIESKCEDFYTSTFNTSEVSYDSSEQNFVLSYKDNCGRTHDSPLTEYSLSQLCSIVGVPSQYAAKCIARREDWAKDLILDNINSWLTRNRRENSLVREYDGNVRGILTDRYTTFDAPDVMQGLFTGFGTDESNFAVEGFCVNPERLHIRIVKKTPVPGINEDLYAGLIVNSSDVGRGAITIGYFLFKQICTNGLIRKKVQGASYRQIHIGSIEDISQNIQAAIGRIGEYETCMAELVRRARKIRYSEEAIINPDSFAHESLFKTIKAQTGLPDKAISNVFDTMVVAYDPTAWGLVNAITLIAQDYTLDRRLNLEEAAGRLLVTA